MAERELGRRLTVDEFRTALQSTGAIINDGDDEVDNVANTGADYRRLNVFALAESLLADPGLPVLSIGDVTVVESDAGTTNAEVVVQLSRSPSTIVTVDFAAADGTATVAGNDYVATSGQLVFLPGGPLTQTIIVPIVGDRTFEPTETFQVVLSGATNATVLQPQATVTIQDNDRERPWQNPLLALDVNHNGVITGLDALIIINRLNTTGPEVLPQTPPPQPYFFYDVSGDGKVTAIDALMVINYLNIAAAQAPPAGLVASGENCAGCCGDTADRAGAVVSRRRGNGRATRSYHGLFRLYECGNQFSDSIICLGRHNHPTSSEQFGPIPCK